jgi:hypothetical protein
MHSLTRRPTAQADDGPNRNARRRVAARPIASPAAWWPRFRRPSPHHMPHAGGSHRGDRRAQPARTARVVAAQLVEATLDHAGVWASGRFSPQLGGCNTSAGDWLS